MSHDESNRSRRRFIKMGLVGIAAAPLSNLLVQKVLHAQEGGDTPKVDPSDPQAQSLHYVEDATKGEGRQENQFCHNCQFYQGDPTAERGPCTIFGGKLVNSNGWCSAYVKKAG